MPELADVAAASGLWATITCHELLVLRVASEALRAAVRPRLIAVLVDQAEQLGPRKRLPALRLLAHVSVGGDVRAAKLAARCFKDSVVDIRHAATKAFVSAATGMDEAEMSQLASTCLCIALSDRDARVCAAAAKALPRLVSRGDEKAIATACKGLSHADATARRAALTALAEVTLRGDNKIIAVVAAVAEGDMDWAVRAAACKALPRLAERGHKVALRALENGLKDPDLKVRHVAAGAVVHISERPSQYFLKWAPATSVATRASGPPGSRKRPHQQLLTLKSPASATPPPMRRRTSGS
jgi:HEAT repeat protein